MLQSRLALAEPTSNDSSVKKQTPPLITEATVAFLQHQSSEVDNILVHRIGGQQQLAGVDPRLALMDLFDYVGESVVVAFRSEFDETVLTREVNEILAIPQHLIFLDLAVLLPSVFPGTQNDSLDDWSAHFGLHAIGRHQAIADAYANAQLLLLLLAQATARRYCHGGRAHQHGACSEMAGQATLIPVA